MANRKVSNNENDIKKAMIERDARMNPPDVEPGMDDAWGDDSWGSNNTNSSNSGDDGWGDAWGSSDNSGSSSGGDDAWGSAGSWGDTNAWGSSSGQQVVQGGNGGSNVEDKVFEGLAVGFKGFGSFMKEFVGSFKTFDYYKKYKCGIRIIFVGGGLAVVGFVVMLFGKRFGLHVMVGSLLSLGVGVPMFLFGCEDYNKNGGVIPETSLKPEGVEEESYTDAWGNDSFDAVECEEEEDTDLWGEEPEDEDEDEDEVYTSGYDELPDCDFEDEKPTVNIEEVKEKALDSVAENKLVTKAYLYEKIVDCLPACTPDFDKEVDLEGTRKFELLCNAVSVSAELLKTGKQTDIPYLISAVDKPFYVELEINRVKWLKNIDKFAEEIVKIYIHNDELCDVKGEKKKNIKGLAESVGDKIYIKIMKGTSCMVSLKDTYKAVEDKILKSSMKMPIVIGLDVEGNVVVEDFWSINSILITGMPRSGKSWFALAVLTQMMMYMSPRDLHVYIFDPKEGVSDFVDMTMPHVRKFAKDEATMLKELRHIVRVEAPRRKKLLGDGNFRNIMDYKKVNPDKELPLIYVMIDEVVTLAESMKGEVKEEFQGLLAVLVSQLPALGIRIMMVPHVVKDQVIKKTTTDLIPCRISVMGDEAHIESSTGTKPKDFEYKLANTGDMAVRFYNDPTNFVHSLVLTPTNEGNSAFFDFLTKLWCKIDPESYKGSYAEQKDLSSKLNSNLGVSHSDKPTHKRQVTIDSSRVLDETEIHKSLEGIHDNNAVSSYEDLNDFWDDED